MTPAPKLAVAAACPVCGVDADSTFADFTRVPVHTNVLWKTRAEATTAPRGDVALAFCESCGLIWNVAFDSQLLGYDAAYESSLHFSPAFQRYAEDLAQRLIERYGVSGKTVVEIGCGKGEFLTLLAERGTNRCVGFDPSYDGESDAANGQIEFVRELYTEDAALGAPDLIVCRHVLEHVEQPRAFLESIRRAVTGAETVLYFEVPAAEYLLRERAVWDVIYAHVSIFGETALRLLFERAGFRVLDSGFSFAGQYLWIEAAPGAPQDVASNGAGPDALRPLVSSFREAVAEKRAHWHHELVNADNGDVALWGAGAKGTTFLNVVPSGDRIGLVVDVNPRKQGMHVPGTGQRIAAPAELQEREPKRVLVMNPIYTGEIGRLLTDLGLAPRLEPV